MPDDIAAREDADRDARQQVTTYADLRASGREIFRLEGNRLVCNCHNRVVMTFDYQAVLDHH